MLEKFARSAVLRKHPGTPSFNLSRFSHLSSDFKTVLKPRLRNNYWDRDIATADACALGREPLAVTVGINALP